MTVVYGDGEFLWVDPLQLFGGCCISHYLSMPGGDAAAREPWRMAVAVVRAFSDGLYPSGFCKRVGDERVRLVERMILSPELSPQTSGCRSVVRRGVVASRDM